MVDRFTHVESMNDPLHRTGNGGPAVLPAGPEPASAGPSATREARSIGDLIKELRDETTTLLRQEVALAKTELTEKATKAARNAAYLAVGGAVAYAGLIVLLIGLGWLASYVLERVGLSPGLAVVVGFLLVGAAVIGVGYLLVHKALGTLAKPKEFVPQKTVESIQENASWAKEKVTT